MIPVRVVRLQTTRLSIPAWALAFLLFGSLAHSRVAAQESAKPNIVVVFTDDQGYQDLGCFGSPTIKTPNVDRLAREGMRFTDFHVAATVCTPSRGALLTGRYPVRLGLAKGVLYPHSKNGLDPSEVTVAEVLREAGYRTACIGKWHLGHRDEFLPTSQGFDEYYGIPYSNDMWLAPDLKLAPEIHFTEGFTLEKTKEIMAREQKTRNQVPLMRGNQVIEFPCDQSTVTRRYVQETVRFIAAHRSSPFFVYLAHSMPHIPLHASPEFKGKSEGGLYGDTIEEIDWGVGEILKCLKENGLDEKTLIVFTSDNGPWLTMGKNGGSALPLRNGKGSTFEGGLRVPCVMRWPGKIPAGTVCDELTCTMDLLPTVCAILGRDTPAGVVLDGRNILDLMRGHPDARSPHDCFLYYSMTGVLSAIRQGDWKLHFELPCFGYANAGEAEEYVAKLQKKPYVPELFNLKEDVGEKRDRAAEMPERVEKLQALAREKAIAEGR